MKNRRIFKSLWLLLPIGLAIFFLVDVSLGSVSIPFLEILKVISGQSSAQETWSEIIFNFRLTKALTCVLAGGGLAIGGLQMQTLFRNPLAGPDVFGLSSGASLAVSMVFMASVTSFSFVPSSSPWIVAIAASIGSGVVSFLVLAISNKVRDNASLLIIGLMIGAGAASVVSVLQYMSPAEDQQAYLLWTFGNVGGMNWKEILVLSLLLLIGASISIVSAKSLNAWMLGDNYAKSLGVNIKRSRLLIIISTSILTGGITAFCGPIAFVGLAVPHLTKLLLGGSDHKIRIPAVFIGGACFMLLCDILSQLPGDSHILPINAITALIGAPVVIWVIMRKRKISS